MVAMVIVPVWNVDRLIANIKRNNVTNLAITTELVHVTRIEVCKKVISICISQVLLVGAS